jgi:hypothetical protein
MKTRTTSKSPRHSPPPLGPWVTHFLLTQTTSASSPADRDPFAPEMLTVRATQITVLLRELLEEKGYRHTGIND